MRSTHTYIVLCSLVFNYAATTALADDYRRSQRTSGQTGDAKLSAAQREADLLAMLDAVTLGPTVGDSSCQTCSGTSQYVGGANLPCEQRPAACNHWTMLPHGLIYGSYLAGAKESRFRGVWHDEASRGNIWDVTLGGRVGLVRYGHLECGRPVGWQLDIEGAGLVRLDMDENADVDAADFRFGIPLTWGDQWSQMKFAYYHLSSHVGDEFLIKNPGFTRLNYSRDVLVLGYSLTPWELWRFYAEMGYGVAVDVAEPWEFQFGIEWAPTGNTGFRGAPFAAFNGHLREEVDYGGNFVVQAGWAWRRSPTSGMFRAGVEYYNGKDDQFSFFDDSHQKVGFGLWYDY